MKALLLVFATVFCVTATAQEIARHDGKPADMQKPVQVFILLGQSNMVGMGKVTGGEGSLEDAVKNKNKYRYLVDDAGAWLERKDVRNVRVMVGRGGGMQLFNNEWMTVGKGKIGPEFGLGHVLGNAVDAPVMILKSCIGNRSLGWDLLPPGSERFEEGGKIYPGYKEKPDVWDMDPVKKLATEPPPWLDKKTGQPIEWYAGKQYDDDTANAKKVLAELDKYYPGAKGYEVAGFFFWQGERTAATPRTLRVTSRTLSVSSKNSARTSTPRTRSSSSPRSAKRPRAAMAMAARSSTPNWRWMAAPASIPNSKATSPQSIPTRSPSVAAATATTAAMPKLT